MKLPLRYFGDPILRAKCKEITEITDEIKALVADMIETMDSLNGVGLAANQVGKSLRLLVIRPEVKLPNGDFSLGPAEVYINPVLSNPSEEIAVMTEGCLSFPGLHVEIERPFAIHVEALDIHGHKISADVSGFKARELMHENDHLNGKFFIDRLSLDLKKAVEPALKKIKEKYLKNN